MRPKDKLIRALYAVGAIQHGNFDLRSGQRSPLYCDIKKAIGDPKILWRMSKMLVLLMPDEATCIATSGYGGIALGTLVSQEKELPLTLVRDKAKEYGTKNLIEGYVPAKHDRVCIVDDVFTTGSNVNDIKRKLESCMCAFVASVVVVNRSQNQEVLSILTESDVKKQPEQTE